MYLALVALPLWILFGNLLVLLSVIGFRHLRTLSNWVIASLAFTDFLLALTVVPFGIYQLVRRFGATLSASQQRDRATLSENLSLIHRVNWRHRIYCHNTFAISLMCEDYHVIQIIFNQLV